mgnify:CR=1 FL=1
MTRKNVVVGVSGGIAAYKSCALIRSFTESGHNVRVIPTDEERMIAIHTADLLREEPKA